MRLEARVLEGGDTVTVLVPLATFIEFKKQKKKSINAAIRSVRDPNSVDDFTDWEPWVAWHALKTRADETREYEAWLGDIEWVGIFEAPDELDPSGGQENQTGVPSPSSSHDAPAPGPSSSSSTTTSKKPSGPSSAE